MTDFMLIAFLRFGVLGLFALFFAHCVKKLVDTFAHLSFFLVIFK